MATQTNNTGGKLGFEDKLWAAADTLRGNMDAAEYKHVVLGLIFLTYISDAFLEKHNALKSNKHADPEDKDEYLAENIFWVPQEARWDYLQKNAKRPEIGTLVDDAMASIERDSKTLKGVLPKDYARPALDKARLGELLDLIATIGLGDKESRQRDILGRVYEYFLGRFAAAVLYDTDTAGNTAKDKLVKSWLTRYQGTKATALSLGPTVGVDNGEFRIKDLFPDAFYFGYVTACYKSHLEAAQIKKITLPPGGMICKRVEHFFKEKGLPNFNKGSVAKRIRTAIKEMKSADNLPEGTADKATALFKAVNDFFETKKGAAGK